MHKLSILQHLEWYLAIRSRREISLLRASWGKVYQLFSIIISCIFIRTNKKCLCLYSILTKSPKRRVSGIYLHSLRNVWQTQMFQPNLHIVRALHQPFVKIKRTKSHYLSLVHMYNIHPGANIHPGCKFAPGVYFGHVNGVLWKCTRVQISTRVRICSTFVGGANTEEQISARVHICP